VGFPKPMRRESAGSPRFVKGAKNTSTSSWDAY
jgi:hypothetical protein